MAEVINQAGRGVNLAGLKPAEVTPTTGTEGRTRVQGIDFGGILDIVKTGVAGYAKDKAAAQKAQKTASENALAQGELDIQFQHLAGGNGDTLARLATGYEEETGTSMTDEQKTAIAEFASLKSRIDDARLQGKSELGLELALNRYRKRFLANHPELGPEALEISGKVNTLSKNAVDLDAEDETAARARRKEQIDTMYKDLNAWGINTVDLNETDALAKWQAEIGPRRNSLAVWKTELEALNVRRDISELERKDSSDSYYHAHVDDLWGTVAAEVSSVVSDTTLDPNARAAGIATALAKWESTIRSTSGITDSAEFNAKYGFIFEPIRKLSNDLASGSISAEAAKNQMAYIGTVARMDFFKKNPKALAMMPLVETYGPLMAAFAKDPTFAPIISGILSSAARELDPQQGSAIEQAGGLDVTGGKNDFATPTDLSDNAKRATAVADAIYKAPPTERSKKDLVNLAVSFLTSPQSKRTLAGVHDIMPALANPKFVEYSQGMDIPADALNMVNEYATEINRSGAVLFQKEADNLIPTLKADGTVTFGFRRPTKNSTDIKRVEADLNRAIKAYAHLSGSTDYRMVAAQFAAEIEAEVQANAR